MKRMQKADISSVIILDITKDDIYEAIEKALSANFIDNLRDRHPAVAFDSKVRGYVGECGIKKWLKSFNYEADSINVITDTYKADIDIIIKGSTKDHLTEIKTSAKPDKWVDKKFGTDDVLLQNCIESGDIKLFSNTKNISNDLDRDIYIQIYFGVKTIEHDNYIKGIYDKNSKILEQPFDYNQIYNEFGFFNYIERCYFVAWIDKKTAVDNNLKLSENKRIYTIKKRDFYTCKIKDAYAPHWILSYLRK